MKKDRLISFINRYYLGGKIEATSWIVDDNTLKTRFISPEKSMMGDLELSNFKGFKSDVEIGVLVTSQLIKMLNVMDNNVEINLNKISADNEEKIVSLNIVDDKKNKLNYMLSDLSVIPTSKGLKQIPEFNLTISLNESFVDTFIKAKSALIDTKAFTIIKNKNTGQYEVVLGYSSINSNRIYMNVECDEIKEIEKPISFSAEYFKEIISANKGAEKGYIRVSSEGLSHVHIEHGDFIANYYLLEVETDI